MKIPDPLLAFSIEPGAVAPTAAPPEPAPQPFAPTEDAPREPQPAPLESLVARVERLERALDESKSQVSSLTSEVETLVRLLRDIRKLSRPAALGVIAATRAARPRMRLAPALVGLTIGLGLGIFGWMYLGAMLIPRSPRRRQCPRNRWSPVLRPQPRDRSLLTHRSRPTHQKQSTLEMHLKHYTTGTPRTSGTSGIEIRRNAFHRCRVRAAMCSSIAERGPHAAAPRRTFAPVHI